MAQPTFSQLTGSESLSELIELVAKLQKQVEWLMGGRLSSDNIRARSIEAESIVTKSLTADEIAAGTITAEEIAAKAITAEKIDVQELSAISADMGKITAGEVYGAYIATKEAAYPRTEMSSASNLFAAFLDANNSLKVAPNISGAPGLDFYAGGVQKATVSVDVGGNDFGFLSRVNAFITAFGFLRLNPIGSVVLVDSFSKLAAGSTTTYQTLDSAFAANMAFDPTTRNLKLYSKSGAELASVNIP